MRKLYIAVWNVLSSRRLAVFRNRSEDMRTLVATALSNAKGKDIFAQLVKLLTSK